MMLGNEKEILQNRIKTQMQKFILNKSIKKGKKLVWSFII